MIRTIADVAKDDERATLLAFGMSILALCVFSALFATSHPSMLRLLSLGYLAGTAGVGFWLYLTNPPLYVGFTWWIWFISPFVRRIIDYSIGSFTPPKMAVVLLAPYVVTGFAIFDLPRFGKLLRKRRYAPFLFCFIGICYALLVGLPKSGAFRVIIALIEWMCPLLLAFHILARPNLYPKFRRIFRSVFAAAVLVLGAYGVYQFFMAPPWDVMWMNGSGMLSVGVPEPMRIRVFGMLDSPGPYAMVMMTGLILLFDGRGIISKLAIIPGYLGFLLALVRGSWGGWVVAVGYSLLRARGAKRGRLLLALGLTLAVLIPVAMSSEIGTRTGARMESFTNLEEDGSLQARQHMYQTATVEALLNPIGEGIGTNGFDSGYVTILYQFGWIGSLFYLGGLFMMIKHVVFNSTSDEKKFETLCVGITLAYTALMFLGVQVKGVNGSMFWTIMSLAVASRLYQERSNAVESASDPSLAAAQ